MTMNRRQVLQGSSLIAASALLPAAMLEAKPIVSALGPRARVMIVNDLAGDPDGLFATVHALLSPSIEVRGIVCSAALGPEETAQRGFETAREMLALMGLPKKITAYPGAGSKLASDKAPVRSAGVQAIIDEALRTDTKLPLYLTVGGGLTEMASALLIEPKIAEKCTLIWIGGNPLGEGATGEYNYGLDPIAARTVFNDTAVPIWQVSSAVYSDCLVSRSELEESVAPHGAIGKWLCDKLDATAQRFGKYGLNTGETWILGDSPLVQLTALSDWVPNRNGWVTTLDRTKSSHFEELFVPRIAPDGSYQRRSDGRKMRHYTSIDTRTMFGDFFAKMRLNYSA
jgi:purine nucleosidase